MKLEQQLNLVQLKTNDMGREATEFSEKFSHLKAKLTEVNIEKNL